MHIHQMYSMGTLIVHPHCIASFPGSPLRTWLCPRMRRGSLALYIPHVYHNRSIEQKSTMVHLVRQSIQEQRRLYSSPSGRTTPTSTLSGYTGRNSLSFTNLHGHFSSSPVVTHLLHRVTSPPHSHSSLAGGYYTPSDTDHD